MNGTPGKLGLCHVLGLLEQELVIAFESNAVVMLTRHDDKILRSAVTTSYRANGESWLSRGPKLNSRLKMSAEQKRTMEQTPRVSRN